MERLRKLRVSFHAIGSYSSRIITPNATAPLASERFSKCKPHLPLIHQNLSKFCGFSSSSHVDPTFAPKWAPPNPSKAWISLLEVYAAVLLARVVPVGFLPHLNKVPYIHRKRFMICPDDYNQEIRSFSGEILPATHPHSVKVCSILEKLLDALHRDLGLAETPRISYHSVAESNQNEISDKGLNENKMKYSGWKTDTSHLKGLNWRIVVVDDPKYSAYTSGGGDIVVHTGLLDRHCDVEIAAALAHEVGHCVAQHVAEYFFFHSMSLYFKTCYPRLSKFVDLDRRSVDIQRRAEIEADYIALQLTASAGYHPNAVLRYFVNLGIILTCGDILKERIRMLFQPHVMEEALAIYRRTKGST